MVELTRRQIGKLGSGAAVLAALGLPYKVLAQGSAKGQLTIGFSADVPTWDPNARTLAAAQSIYKTIFDQPLAQNENASPKPALVTKYVFSDPKTLEIDLRTDVLFHDGTKMTSEDFKYSFFERQQQPVPQGGRKLDTSFIWRKLVAVETPTASKVIMRFSEPMPSAVAWLYFFCSFVVPKAYVEKVGVEEFTKKPIGTGPYKFVEYQQGARLVLESNENYWGGAPKIKNVTIEFIRDPTARVAAFESKRIDVAVDVPIREAQRLGAIAGTTASIYPITDIMLLQVTKNGGFAEDKARLAAHHAIDKAAISKALFGGFAPVISVPAALGSPGYPPGYEFKYDPAKSTALLKELGYGPDKPLKIKIASTNGVFPNDFDMARAIVQMWKRVGIDAELEAIETSVYQERLRAGTLPEATLYSWGNAAAEPEFYGGYLLDPKSIFSAFKSDELAPKIQPLLTEVDEAKRLAGYQDAHKFAADRGFTIPLLQTVKTVVHVNSVNIVKHENGHILPQTYSFKS